MSGAALPGPKGSLLLGSLPTLKAEGPFRFWERLWRDNGDLVGVRLGPVRAALIVHPDDVETVLIRQADRLIKGLGYRDLKAMLGNGLITSEEPLWRRQRRALQPAFTPAAVPAMDGDVAAAGHGLVARWRDKAAAGESLDLAAEMTTFSMAAASRAIFGVDLAEDRLDIARAFDACFAFMAAKTTNPYAPPLVLPTGPNRAFRRDLAAIDRFIAVLIDRSAVMERPTRVFARLFGAVDKPVGAADRRQIRDEVVSLFFAGYETTAETLTWALILLLRHPEVLSELRAEVDMHNGHDPAEILPDLDFTRAVIEETLRLYPPVPMIARQVREPVVVGDHLLGKRSLIVFVPYLTQRHPQFWDAPDTFRPERFLDGGPHVASRYAYFPFGAGARICIGQHFALREVIATLALIVRSFDIEEEGAGPIEPAFNGTLKPGRRVLLRIRPRVVT